MSSGFISETEIESQRQRRQEEWEKVRTPDQPLDAPEEEYDPRSLYDRLQEQKQKKEFEYEEAHKLKNMIKGLDDDEVDFLDLVDKSKLEEEKRKNLEEKKELNEFRMRKAWLEEESVEQRIKNEMKSNKQLINSSITKISSQSKLLAGALVKKSSSDGEHTSSNKKRKLSEGENVNSESVLVNGQNKHAKSSPHVSSSTSSGALIECIGILPGIGSYDQSSDSDPSSSDFETEQPVLDLLGRKIVKKREASSEDN